MRMGLETITWVLRIATLGLPPLAGYVAYRIAASLQAAERPTGAEEPASEPSADEHA
jgi:hypothetical protein